MRDGCLLHPLQPAAGAPGAHPQDRAQPLLQAEELQNRRQLRPETAGARTQARRGPADEEDPSGLIIKL